MSLSRRTRYGVVLGVLATILLPTSSVQASADCIEVFGEYVERPVVGPDCDSPVGLCIAAVYRGGVKGDAHARATSIVSTSDSTATSVQLFTSDSTIAGSVAGRPGTLIVKNAGAFASAGDGSIVDLQTIVGGTGRLAGASGTLRAQGTFVFPDGGRSRYTGTVCLKS
ncbi:DUF3224 domain-containing protein [Allorhizocola rhizosphaerae]|uniref:DUF3224 domain-containing protein n=1 Tax=Allorhizocola rhizosphaerae TaxID=1872709 RepID=UPI000E3DB9B3|nr:DUF3224 domain-containing protein [Allorhizocola rhizosphaerae]